MKSKVCSSMLKRTSQMLASSTSGLLRRGPFVASQRSVVTKITSIPQFEKSVVSEAPAGKLIIIDYKADWCGPCKRISPIFEGLSEEYKDDALFFSVDCDEMSELAAQRGIASLPTFEFIKDGFAHDQLIGANPSKLEDYIKKYIDLM